MDEWLLLPHRAIVNYLANNAGTYYTNKLRHLKYLIQTFITSLLKTLLCTVFVHYLGDRDVTCTQSVGDVSEGSWKENALVHEAGIILKRNIIY